MAVTKSPCTKNDFKKNIYSDGKNRSALPIHTTLEYPRADSVNILFSVTELPSCDN